MRWPETAIARRNDLLARTRRLTLLVAGAASAASIGLATVLGLSIPGKAATTTGTQAPTAPNPSTSPAPRQPGQPGRHSRPGQHGPRPGHGHRHLAPPKQPPAPAPATSTAPPATKSGGS